MCPISPRSSFEHGGNPRNEALRVDDDRRRLISGDLAGVVVRGLAKL
jgi:hypothetical protein